MVTECENCKNLMVKPWKPIPSEDQHKKLDTLDNCRFGHKQVRLDFAIIYPGDCPDFTVIDTHIKTPSQIFNTIQFLIV